MAVWAALRAAEHFKRCQRNQDSPLEIQLDALKMIYDFGSILVYSLFLKEVEETLDKNSEQFKGILAKIYKCSARIY